MIPSYWSNLLVFSFGGKLRPFIFRVTNERCVLIPIILLILQYLFFLVFSCLTIILMWFICVCVYLCVFLSVCLVVFYSYLSLSLLNWSSFSTLSSSTDILFSPWLIILKRLSIVLLFSLLCFFSSVSACFSWVCLFVGSLFYIIHCLPDFIHLLCLWALMIILLSSV